ncbi:MAG TPA: HAD-IA family hydrolase [Dissulfurispiraceae bacterium]
MLIFDLDGTLVDSSGDICDSINYAVAPCGVPPISVGETVGLVGEGITRLMEKIIEKEGLRVDKDALVKRFLDYYAAHLVDKTTVYPGVRETLEGVDGYKKAVISNKLEALSLQVLERLGIARYFDLIVGSDTTPERKPSPVPVLHVLSRLDVRPEAAAIVGDSNYDVEAGKAAGIRTIAVTYGYRTVDFLRGADFIIKRMDELTDILKRI